MEVIIHVIDETTRHQANSTHKDEGGKVLDQHEGQSQEKLYRVLIINNFFHM